LPEFHPHTATEAGGSSNRLHGGRRDFLIQVTGARFARVSGKYFIDLAVKELSRQKKAGGASRPFTAGLFGRTGDAALASPYRAL